MNPNDPNYPPGLSPQLDPTITPQAAPGAPPPPGLFSTGMQGHVFGQHEARLQSNDIAAGYVAGGITGAAEAGLRAGQLFGMHSEVFRMAANHAEKAATGARLGRFTGEVAGESSEVLFQRARSYRRLMHISGTMDPFYAGRMGARGMTGLANLMGSPFGVQFGGDAARASRLGRLTGSTRMARFAGTAARIGMRLPGMAGGVASFGLTLAAQEAAIQSVGQIYEGHADRMRSATLVNQTAGMSGVSYSQNEARGSGLTDMASSMGMEFDEFSGLSQMLAQGGSFQGVNNLQEFKAKLRSSLQQLKQIAEVTNTTLQEAGQIGLALKQQGFSGGQMPAAAAQAFGLGQATGLGAGAFVQMGGMGAQYGAATNMGMSRGSAMFQQALGGVEFAMQRGAFSQEMIQRMGGSSSSATMALMQGTMGQAGMMGTTVSQMMGFIAKKGEGEYSTPIIDQEKLERLLNGNVTRQELAAVSQSQQVLGMSTAIQRAAMPQINQMLHSTLSAGTTSPEEYLRKAEMMGIPPDVAKLIMETERNRDFTNAATQLAVGQNMAQQSVSQSSRSFVGRLFSGEEMGLGVFRSMREFGGDISAAIGSAPIFAGERAEYSPTAAGRRLMMSEQGVSSLMVGPQFAPTGMDIIDRASGSGNPFSKGRGEARREAMYREFESLYRRADKTRSRVSTDGMFGETSFGRRLVNRDAINAVLEDQASFRATERQINLAKFGFTTDEMNIKDLFNEQLGISGTSQMFDRPAREELAALAIGQKLGIDTPGFDIGEMAQNVIDDKELTQDQRIQLQQYRNRVHAVANAAGFDAQSLIGGSISGQSNFGRMTMSQMSARAEVMASEMAGIENEGRATVGTRAALLVTSGPLAALAANFFTQGTKEQRAVKDFLSGPSADANIEQLLSIRQQVGSNATADDIRSVLASNRIEGDLAKGLLEYAQGGFQGLDERAALAAGMHYQRVVNPIAEGIGSRIQNMDFEFSEFGANLRQFGSDFGRRDVPYADRTRAMEIFMRQSLGDGSLRDEAVKLREKGLNDVARLFNTVEVLAGGNAQAIERQGFDPNDFKGMDRNQIITELGERGLLSGAAGAQAQAAGQSLEGRSLAGDLLAFSQRVEDLAGVVRQMQIDQGLVAPESIARVEDPAGNEPEGTNSVLQP